MPDLVYKDTVSIVTVTLSSDGYGTEIIESVNEVPALVIHDTGFQHGNYRSEVNSDAEVYLDPTDSFVIDNYNRLEEMYVIANQFGNTDAQEWYKVEKVIVGEDKLLSNQIDNVKCQLKKSSVVPNVS